MSQTIAITGKGGTGKTTFSALTILNLVRSGLKPVLAVDADPNSNLHTLLGVNLERTIGSVREEMGENVQKMNLPAGISKQEILEIQIEQAIIEAEDFDLISMGRPEGPGCYCAVNNMLRVFLERLSEHYKFVIIDNEAGMEHLSRRTTRGAEVMFVMSDGSSRGLETALRIRDLALEMKIKVGKFLLVLTRVKMPLSHALRSAIEEIDIELGGVIPEDEEILELDARGIPLTKLSEQSTSYLATKDIMKETLVGVKA